jgi:hypothetical protein
MFDLYLEILILYFTVEKKLFLFMVVFGTGIHVEKGNPCRKHANHFGKQNSVVPSLADSR